jgi:Ring finger domain
VFVGIRNDLWFLAGQLRSLSIHRRVQNYLARQNQPGNLDTTISDALGLTGRPPASLSAIQALSKEKIGVSAPGELGEEVCPICFGPIEATKLPCGHWFHFDCVEPWMKKHDSCPSCRASIEPTGT